jgi:hypothetical protein
MVTPACLNAPMENSTTKDNAPFAALTAVNAQMLLLAKPAHTECSPTENVSKPAQPDNSLMPRTSAPTAIPAAVLAVKLTSAQSARTDSASLEEPHVKLVVMLDSTSTTDHAKPAQIAAESAQTRRLAPYALKDHSSTTVPA